MPHDKVFAAQLQTLGTWGREIQKQQEIGQPTNDTVKQIISQHIDQTINRYARMPKAQKDARRGNLIAALCRFEGILDSDKPAIAGPRVKHLPQADK